MFALMFSLSQMNRITFNTSTKVRDVHACVVDLPLKHPISMKSIFS